MQVSSLISRLAWPITKKTAKFQRHGGGFGFFSEQYA
jgi:hypothetical protein